MKSSLSLKIRNSCKTVNIVLLRCCQPAKNAGTFAVVLLDVGSDKHLIDKKNHGVITENTANHVFFAYKNMLQIVKYTTSKDNPDVDDIMFRKYNLILCIFFIQARLLCVVISRIPTVKILHCRIQFLSDCRYFRHVPNQTLIHSCYALYSKSISTILPLLIMDIHSVALKQVKIILFTLLSDPL